VAHPELGYCCNACGGARIPAAETTKLSGKERAPLARASAARTRRIFYWIGAAAAAPMLLFVALAALGVASVAHSALGGALIGGLLGVPLAAALAACVRGAKNAQKIVGHALEEAWLSAASDVVRRAGRALTASELGEALGVSELRAEELLTLRDVNELLGEPAASAEPRLRIEALGGRELPHREHDGDVAAALEAEAEAEQDASDGALEQRAAR
jgi:hypothetical protein